MTPETRKEKYLAKASGDYSGELPEPVTREEKYLFKIAESGGGGGDSSEYAHSLELTIDSQTYVLTATLKNTDGDTLGTPQTIDLPLESMVVGGSYDDTTKKVILTLKNGNTVEFSVADLVSGLQAEITSTNKLNSDLVDDTNQNNKFVTSAEKEKINNALTEEVYNAGKTIPKGTTYIIGITTYTVGDNAEIFGDYSNNKAIGNDSHAEGKSTKAVGNYSHAEGGGTKAIGDCSHAEGGGTTASGGNSHAEGSGTTASGGNSHAEGSSTKAIGDCSHAEGDGTTASGGNSHAEGGGTTASGGNSHAEGSSTKAIGNGSHAEGGGTTASGDCSHAEGGGTKAIGNGSHAEGGGTTASGGNSHAEGGGTIAASDYQHVQGKYNIEDSNSKYAFIIGNGTSNSARSNAFAVDWDGKIYVNNSATGVNVSQLQPIIDSTNKLNSDLVDDTDPNVNKFVTSAEKAQIATNTHDIAIIKSMIATTFGFKINKNDMNPNTRVEYLYDAVGMNPAYMDFTNDVFSYGDWGNAWFVKDNRPVALKFDGTVDYELDHSDFTKKLDGTASDITDTTYSGNFMSEIPLVYIKRWEDENYNYIAISNNPVDDSYKAYAHTNANGIIKPQIYLPMFKGSIVDNKLRSIAGQFPTGNTTGANDVSYAEACGSGWQLWDWSKHELIADLLTLISRSTDSKGRFGKGDINSYRNASPDYGKQPTGGYCSTVGDLSTFAVDSNGQFYGKNDDTHHVTAFYIEDFWGNRYDRCLGLNLDNGVYKVKMIPPYTIDTDSTYTTVQSISVPSSGWLKNIRTSDYGGLPSQTNTTETTDYCNYFYSNTSSARLALFGGFCSYSSGCGYRCVNLNCASSYIYWTIGGSPCFNPL